MQQFRLEYFVIADTRVSRYLLIYQILSPTKWLRNRDNERKLRWKSIRNGKLSMLASSFIDRNFSQCLAPVYMPTDIDESTGGKELTGILDNEN